MAESTPTRCAGSDRCYTFAPADGRGISMATGQTNRARVICRTCGREFVGRVWRTMQGIDLGPNGQVVVPRHNAGPFRKEG